MLAHSKTITKKNFSDTIEREGEGGKSGGLYLRIYNI